jgi:hypothetical protein
LSAAVRCREVRRLTRQFFVILAALSLLLFFANLIFWHRSYRCTEQLLWQPTTGDYWLSTAKGSLVLGIFRVKDAYAPSETFRPRYHRDDGWINPPMSPFFAMELDPPLTTFDWDHAGLTLQTRTAFPRQEFHLFLAARCVLLAGLTAILPLSWIALRFRTKYKTRRATRHGLCPACGYDLRASPDRCPECGTPATANR